jgi:hypothetical protein
LLINVKTSCIAAKRHNIIKIGEKNMKKLTASIITLTLALTLAACGGGSGGTYTGTIPDAAPAQETAATTPEPAPDNGSETTDPTSDQTPASEPLVINGVGETLEFGGYEWRVLEVSNGKALLLSEYILEERKYHNEWTEITWADCDLRSYLNGEFYNSFGEGEKARIAQTRVSNKDNQWEGTPGGDDTDDYVFLLSIEEVVQYFGDSGQLSDRPTNEWGEGAYSINDDYNERRIAYDRDGNVSSWCLRSPGLLGDGVTEIGSGGGIIIADPYGYAGGMSLVGNSYGLRPAMWVTLE